MEVVRMELVGVEVVVVMVVMMMVVGGGSWGCDFRCGCGLGNRWRMAAVGRGSFLQ
jgi:hypothetical protein